MNNKFNKQKFPTKNIKQIILRNTLNFNQSLSITLTRIPPSTSTKSTLKIKTILNKKYKSLQQQK